LHTTINTSLSFIVADTAAASRRITGSLSPQKILRVPLPSTSVFMRGLVAASEVDRMKGVIQSFKKEKGRCVVGFLAGFNIKHVLVKSENCFVERNRCR